MSRKILITSALPYVYDTKRLGNLAGSLLPADVHARFHHQIGSTVLFIRATDEHGTPAELAAAAACQTAPKVRMNQNGGLNSRLNTRGYLAFYKENPLSTPPGFQVLKGGCADVPEIAAIRRAQVLRDREFDALIRADAAKVVCGRDSSPSYRFMDLIQERTRDENTNAWVLAEITFMTIGGGRYVGSGATRKGAPRPPLCHIE